MSSPRACGLTRSRLRDWLVTEGITVTFLPTPVAEGVDRSATGRTTVPSGTC